MDQENCPNRFARRRLCDDVVVRDPIDRGGLVLELSVADRGYLHLGRMKTRVSAVGAGVEAARPAEITTGETFPLCTRSGGSLAMKCVVAIVEHCQDCHPIFGRQTPF